jgi:predicted metal-dependent phosphoesterase TrpH
LIDLHTHTTASDGRLAPAALARQAHLAGITVLGVTDHDTTEGVPAVAAAAVAYGLAVVPGIEITAVHEGRDVHVLGYFVDPASPALADFLAAQRADRVRRALDIAGRLAALGCPIDTAPLVARGDADGVVARPLIAAALVEAGHVATIAEAFDRLIGEGQPAYVPRRGAAPADVVAIVARAGGVASLAHPGLLGRDDLIPALAAAGLPAIEVYHSDHDEEAQARYRGLAGRFGLAVTGGSDFHGDDAHRHAALGSVALPEADYRRLRARAGRGART